MTSTALAHELLAAGQLPGGARWVVINHMDCDSVLSSAMLMGYLPASAELVRASVCADHTGAEHPVADLLQALDEARHGDRTEEQYLESLRSVERLLAGEPLEPGAAHALAARQARRAETRRIVARGDLRRDGPVAFAVLDAEIDGAFFPALVPDAAVIVLACAHAPERWAVKVRLGAGAPAGLTLHTLRITDWDPAFGGRWNAGSNKRGGGTVTPVEQYAARVRSRIGELPR